jgi:hypothetical protein
MSLQAEVDALGEKLNSFRSHLEDVRTHELLGTISAQLRKIVAIVKILSDATPSSSSIVVAGRPPPVPPPTTLSIAQLRIVYTVLELLWVCELHPFIKYLAETITDGGSILSSESEHPYPKSLLVSKEELTDISAVACREYHSLYSQISTSAFLRALSRTLLVKDVISNEVFLRICSLVICVG